MNIGDRVRLMHSRDEGIVVAVKGDIIEVEIEDGFTIPATRKEVVLVSKEESARFQPNPSTTSVREERRTAIFADTGIFVAIIPTTQTTFELYLINNTDFTIALNLFQDQQNRFKGLFTGVFKPKTAEFVKNLLSADGDLPELLIQGIYYSDYLNKLKDPITKKVRIKPFIISGKQTKGPIIGKNGYIIQIDGEQIPVNKEKLKESMEDSTRQDQPMVFISPGKEIDLHIEKLTHIDQKYSNSEMLKIQLNAFELALDQAIAAGQDEIKFIHGIGNGVLRAEIQKRLSKMKNIKFFEDAQKERFGYGATLVKIK